MNKEEVQKKITEAKELVGGDPKDPLTQIAFGEVLRMLLQSSLQDVEIKKGVTTGVVTAQQMQISEFLAQANIKTETERVVAILYHHFHNGQPSSTRAEIVQAYSSARIRLPKNLSDVIARCIRKGHIIEAPERKEGAKAWQITQTIGEKHIRELIVSP
jgi:hypothetical protein